MVSRLRPLALTWLLLTGTALGSPPPAPRAAFAPGTLPGTLRYQVVVSGVARTDLRATLGALENLEVVAGPMLAQHMNWQEGRVTAVTVVTWVLQALAPGPIAVGPSHLAADGVHLESNAVAGVAWGGGVAEPRDQPPALTGLASRTRVVVGEVFRVQYSAQGDLPGGLTDWAVQASFPGAWSQPMPPVSGVRPAGTPGSAAMGAYLVIAASAGELRIPPATARRIGRGERPEGMLLGGDILTSPEVRVTVDPLPAPPPGFFGAVGDLHVSRRLLNETVVAGDPMVVEVAVAGRGNFPAMAQPDQPWPSGIRPFPAETEDRWESHGEALLGERSWRIPLTTLEPGELTLPGTVLATFHPEAGYREHRLPPLTATVLAAGTLDGRAAAESGNGVPAPPRRDRWLPFVAAMLAFLLGVAVAAAVPVLRRRLRLRRQLPPPSADPVLEAEHLARFLDGWLRERHGSGVRLDLPGLLATGMAESSALEAISLAESLRRLRIAPGLGDTTGALAQIRARLVRLITSEMSTTGTLPV